MIHYGFKESDIAYVAKTLDQFFDSVTNYGMSHYSFQTHCDQYARLIVSALKQPEYLDYDPEIRKATTR